MEKDRLLAFSDGVVAIIITIMVLELKVPKGANFEDIAGILPVFLSYVLSFVYVAIYWNNHHHLLYTVIWLSLVPFATAWMGENHFAKLPTAVYGVALLMPAIAYFLLQKAILRREGRASTLARAWDGHQGEDFSASLRGGHRLVVRRSAHRGRYLRVRGHHVADPGQAH